MSISGDHDDENRKQRSTLRDGITVPASLAGERVDRAVVILTGWSRADAARVIAAGGVVVDGAAVSKSRRLVEGDLLAVHAAPPAAEAPGPEPVPVSIRYEDTDLVVVAKAAGQVVHPGAGHKDDTLVNGLLERFPEMSDVGDPMRPGIVHRLDRDTSGLMVVARSARAYLALTAMISDREVVRRYAALVWGKLDAQRGVIDAPIGRSPHRPTRMAVRRSGKPARTRYEVDRVFSVPSVSLLRVELETGRTHQIRVHCAAIRHPVVGDSTYGGRRDSVSLGHPFLHAAHLELRHPVTGEPLVFDEPLPPDLQTVLDNLEPS